MRTLASSLLIVVFAQHPPRHIADYELIYEADLTFIILFSNILFFIDNYHHALTTFPWLQPRAKLHAAQLQFLQLSSII